MWVAKDFRSVVDLVACSKFAYPKSNLFDNTGDVVSENHGRIYFGPSTIRSELCVNGIDRRRYNTNQNFTTAGFRTL
jgi:hypothetical protein